MSLYGPQNPQQIWSNNWSSQDGAKVADGSSASKLIGNGPDGKIDATKSQLGIPGDGQGPATQVTARVTRKADSAGVKDHEILLFAGGQVLSANKADYSQEWSTGWETAVYIWDNPGIGPAQMNAGNFGLRIVARKTGGQATVFVDGITLEAVK